MEWSLEDRVLEINRTRTMYMEYKFGENGNESEITIEIDGLGDTIKRLVP